MGTRAPPPLRLLLPLLLLVLVQLSLPVANCDTDLVFDNDSSRVVRQVSGDYNSGDPEDDEDGEDTIDDRDNGEYDDDGADDVSSGSGYPRNIPDPADNTEKNIRVWFTIKEPWDADFQNIRSGKWQHLSHTLANAVNELYDQVDGDQSASLVKVESAVDDHIACKVFLDIRTSTHDYDEIVNVLRSHIRNTGRLSNITVTDKDFNFSISNGSEVDNEINTDDIVTDIPEEEEEDRTEYPVRCDAVVQCINSSVKICEDQVCDNRRDCPDGQDEENCSRRDCEEDEMSCDITRCIPLTLKCNNYDDCEDRSDERDCPERCNPEHSFQCRDGSCIPKEYQCNRQTDCRGGEDEYNCPCSSDEFQCNDGTCIESRKQCDRRYDCRDRSDEENCTPDVTNNTWSGAYVCQSRFQFMCGDGSCISIMKRCDGSVDCPKDSADESGCPCKPDQWQCDYGSCISQTKKCDGFVDCPIDRSDERFCFEVPEECSDEDFRCNSGSCIPSYLRCDRNADCDDGSDEYDCPSESDRQCADYQFRCNDGTCISDYMKCDKNPDCRDGSDEADCAPLEGSCDIRCGDGKCLDASKRCNEFVDCNDGIDEKDCQICEADQFRCNDGSCISIDKQCDRVQDCGDGSDEYDCPSTGYECKDGDFDCIGSCIPMSRRCDRFEDCPNGTDEIDCEPLNCGPGQFHCDGNCFDDSKKCDNTQDCYDGMDEENCNLNCEPDQHMCGNGQCISYKKVCDKIRDCDDNSDEEECKPEITCSWDQWQCQSGECISTSKRCDGYPDCSDRSDEDSSCPRPVPPTYPPQPNEDINLKTYPNEQDIKRGPYSTGGEVVFQCRDESINRAPVEWIRDGGRQLPAGSTNNKGRLVMPNVQVSDSGTYICQAKGYPRNYPGRQKSVHLTVEPYKIDITQPAQHCRGGDATCSNGQCIPKYNVCNGVEDCSDGSDEVGCSIRGVCEPNEFRCENKRCILKSWVCDSEDDCKDGSDEANCHNKLSESSCRSTEFQCNSKQCIPKSYHCDGEKDCDDGTDEYGCSKAISITLPPPPRMVLSVGETFTITCRAIGVPVPEIIWRRNWGHIPEKCHYTSVSGFGTLICPDIQVEDSGAYSCEAINNKGNAFAVPDTLLFVNHTETKVVCPPGYFNIEARSQHECISCFCFGATTQCRSADLFTYQLPLPFVPTKLVGVVRNPDQTLESREGATEDIFDFRPNYGGGVVSRIANWSPVNNVPFIPLTEGYLGNQLTSYGGYIKYVIRPTGGRPVAGWRDLSLPDIIIKSGDSMIFYKSPTDLIPGTDNTISARLFYGSWDKINRHGKQSASREDIMMILANVDTILLRAEENGNGVEIKNFQMDSAKADNSGQGLAAYVEECTCPSGYSGLSCQKCSAGYIRRSSGPWLGQCVPSEPECRPGYYGNPNAGIPCLPCPCPLTTPKNQFARTCELASDGRVTCHCPRGYIGRHCETCDVDYVGNPTSPGDYCRPRPPPSHCDARGTLSEQGGRCKCKPLVTGARCSECAPESFHLSSYNMLGCSRCFCMGVVNACHSSNWRRRTIQARFGSRFSYEHSTVRLVEWRTSQSEDDNTDSLPFQETTINADKQEVTASDFDPTKNQVYYWSMPESFVGDKITAYGGIFTYTVRHTPGPDSYPFSKRSPDVQLVSKNDMTFVHYSNATMNPGGYLTHSVPILETHWFRTDGHQLNREYLLMALADIKYILVKATYTTKTERASFVNATLDIAEERGTGDRAVEVEECHCPPQYIGTSCEDCAPGYTRTDGGLYLGTCEACKCNGHSDQCHPNSGECSSCQHNTRGVQCNECEEGFEGDPKSPQGCIPQKSRDRCLCDVRGTQPGSCESGSPVCRCKAHTEGTTCNRCKAGTFKLSQSNALGCIPCYCSGVADVCHEADRLHIIQIPIEIFDNSHGFSLTTLDQRDVIDDNFSLDIPLSRIGYHFGPTGESLIYYWSLPSAFIGNKLTSYGGSINITQSYESSYRRDDEELDLRMAVVLVGRGKTLYWNLDRQIPSNEAMSYIVPLMEENWFMYEAGRPSTYHQPVSRNDFLSVLSDLKLILVKANPSRKISSTYISDVSMDIAIEGENSQPLAEYIEVCRCPDGYNGLSCETCAAGYYRDNNERCERCPCNGREESCSANAERGVTCVCKSPFGGPNCLGSESASAFASTERSPELIPPLTIQLTISEPTIQIKAVGSTVQFTCKATGYFAASPVLVKWRKEGGQLPYGRTIQDVNQGSLVITRVIESDSGTYICEASDGIAVGENRAILTVPGSSPVPPEVSLHTNQITEFNEGERIELRCEATGYPIPNLSWVRTSRRPLSRFHRLENGVLTIERAQYTDQGEYRCIGSNSVGNDQKVVSITVHRRHPTQYLTVHPPNLVYREGEDAEISCYATPELNKNLITWSRVGGYLPDNFQSVSGTLRISSIREDDAGKYMCSAERTLDSITPVTIEIIVARIPIDPPSPANVQVEIDNVTLIEGQQFMVKCTPYGNPLPIVKWTKYESEMEEGTKQYGNALRISKAKYNDRGMYICIGLVDGEKVAESATSITVERREMPVVEIYPSNRTVIRGQRIELQCRISRGIPPPEIFWTRLNRPLSPDSHLQPNGILVINNFDVNDEGEYICSASNAAGEHSAHTYIKMITEPQIEIYPQEKIKVRSGQNIDVECRATGTPEPVVYWKKIYPDEIIKTAQSYSPLYMNFNNIQSEDGGTYACIGSNDAGEVEARVTISYEDTWRGDIPEVDTNTAETTNHAIVGEKVELRCDHPSGTVFWVRQDDRRLPATSRQEGNVLNLYNVSKADSGNYECVVMSHDIVIFRTSILVVVRQLPQITLDPQTQTVRPGDNAYLECIVTGDEPLTVTWIPINGSFPSHVQQKNRRLEFNGITVEDAGLYICTARNPVGEAEGVGEVIVGEKEESTHNVGYNRNLEVAANVKATLTCNAADNIDHERINWRKDGGKWPKYGRQLDSGILVIEKVQLRDSGKYECQVKTATGVVITDYVNLIVTGPVMNSIEISPNQKTVREGEDIVVSCRTRGQNFDVRWSKESSNERLNTIHARGGLDLIIKGVTTRDSGNYRCDGRDRNGTPYNEDFTLTVVADNRRSVSYPDMQQDEPEVHQAALGTNVHMPCKTNMPAPVRFQWERPYAKLTTDEHVESVDEPVLVLKSIDESHAGPYTCKTSNGESNSERKIILKVTHVVPRFEGSGYIELPKWDDTFYYFDMDIAIRPEDPNGIIFYESHLRGKNSGDFITLTLNDGVPEFTFMFQTLPTTIRADRPISMNEWHIINISRIRKNAYMKVDDRGPFPGEGIGSFEGLELEEPMYIGGVPEYEEINDAIKIRKGFTGCIGRLVLDKTDISLMKAGRDKVNILECNSCLPNPCKNKAICQDASTDRGYSCLCPDGFSGIDCSLTGDACRTGLCGKGKCEDTRDGFKCICPIGYIGDRCDTRLDVEYPAFGGEAYIAYAAPKSARLLNMGLRIKPNYPMRDGLILYCAESRLGEGHFTSLAVKDRYLEFRYGIGSSPVVIRSQKPLVADEWVNVNASRFGQKGKLEVEGQETMTMSPPGTSKKLDLNTALYVGGYDEKYMTINKGTGVENGFKGCIADVIIQGSILSIVNNSIESSNIRKCDGSTHPNDSGRGDIPPDMTESSEEEESVCSQCKNGGWCRDSHATQCECRDGYTGKYCEYQQQPINTYNHCDHLPCQGNGTCRPLRDGLFKCDCPLGTGGFNCQNRVELGEDCSLTGEGYVELPASLLPHNSGLNSEFMAISFTTSEPDGLLILQGEEGKHYRDGDFMLLNINQGLVEFEWNLGEGVAKIANSRVHVSNGERHNIIVKRTGSEAMLEVDGVEDIGRGPGLTQTLNANSNIFIGGTPSHMTASGLIGFSGCIHQIEFPEANAVNIGRVAVASRNANPCSNDEDNTVELIEAQ